MEMGVLQTVLHRSTNWSVQFLVRIGQYVFSMLAMIVKSLMYNGNYAICFLRMITNHVDLTEDWKQNEL